MKKVAYGITLGLLFSCSSSNSPEKMKKTIAQNEEKIRELEVQNEDLKKQLASIDTAGIDTSALIPVNVKKIIYEPFKHYIEVNGNVEPAEEAFISPETSGQIKKIHVSEGQSVQKGQLLISLNTEVTESSILEIKTNLELATTLYEKQKELWDQKIGSELQFLEAKNNKESAEAKLKTLQAQLDMSRITAAFNGIVDDILKKEGELASPGVQILHLVNIDKMKIYANISEAFLNDVNKGETVTVEFPALPDINLKVPIYRIGTVINNQSRTFTIELQFNNPHKQVKPNIISTVKINDFYNDSALIVPSIIIKEDRNGKFLFTVKEDGQYPVAKKTYVQTGKNYQDETMLVEGISTGQKVITSGYNLVSDEMPVIIR